MSQYLMQPGNRLFDGLIINVSIVSLTKVFLF